MWNNDGSGVNKLLLKHILAYLVAGVQLGLEVLVGVAHEQLLHLALSRGRGRFLSCSSPSMLQLVYLTWHFSKLKVQITLKENCQVI